MTKHSAIVGGSTAGRLLACPGSFKATQALPPSADISSEYAAEGTAMHAVMDRLMRQRALIADGMPEHPQATPQYWKGQIFVDRVLTPEHIDEMIDPALRALDELEVTYGDNFTVVAVARRDAFPGIPGAFGTVDLILANDDTVILVDWKFGSGVPVKAIYTDALEGDLVNPQLLFYTTAAYATLKKLFRGKSVLVAAIVQPRADEPLTHTTITRTDMKWFKQDMAGVVVEALERDPIRRRGEHCRFAPCKVDCPLWTGPMLELSALNPQPRTEPVDNKLTPYGQYLADAKALADQLAMFSSEVNDQLHAYLEDGGMVPGWRLKAKVKQRQWIDEDTVVKRLTNLGLKLDEIYQTKLGTFKQVEAAAKRHGTEIPDELRVAPATHETTVCRTDDPAPVVQRHLAIEQFAASLALLKGSQKKG